MSNLPHAPSRWACYKMYIHHLYSLTPGGPQATNHSNLHFNVIGVDEWGGEASIRISGHHTCDEGCTWSDRILLVSVPSKSQDGEGLPPAQAMVLPPGPAEVSQTIKLPVAGDPIRYPFDRFRLTLGVILQRVYPDGRVQALTPEQVVEDGRHLFLSMHMQAPRITISTLKMIDPASIFSDGPQYIYIAATDITFSRPLYLQLLTVSLVLLITAAAAYAVFMRLNQLVINSGALVLGVWGNPLDLARQQRARTHVGRPGALGRHSLPAGGDHRQGADVLAAPQWDPSGAPTKRQSTDADAAGLEPTGTVASQSVPTDGGQAVSPERR